MSAPPPAERSKHEAWWARRVQLALAPRRKGLTELQGALKQLQQRHSRVRGLVAEANQRLDAIEGTDPLGRFSPAMTVDQAWRRHPGAPEVFARHHLPSCDSCSVRFDETLAEACHAYGIEQGALLKQLNSLLPWTSDHP